MLASSGQDVMAKTLNQMQRGFTIISLAALLTTGIGKMKEIYPSVT